MANPNPFTPEEVAQILEAFFAAVGTRQYVGARYVPFFGRKGEDSIIWDNSAPYEPLTIVLYQGNSFTSRQYVPAGVEITNDDFWAETGNYNAQVEQYRQEVALTNDMLHERIIFSETAYEIRNISDLSTGDFIKTGGFANKDDGGASLYIVTQGTANNINKLETGIAGLIAEKVNVGTENASCYGILPNTNTDATENLRIAIANTHTLIFDSGKYYFSISQENESCATVDNSLHIIGAYGCEFVFDSGNLQGGSLLTLLSGCLFVEGVTLTGNASLVGDNVGNYVMGISVRGGHVRLNDCTIRDFSGDGIYHATPTDETSIIDGCQILHCGRNCVSIVDGDVSITNSKIESAFKFAPRACIDVEPNTTDEKPNVYLDNLYLANDYATLACNFANGISDTKVNCGDMVLDGGHFSFNKVNISFDNLALNDIQDNNFMADSTMYVNKLSGSIASVSQASSVLPPTYAPYANKIYINTFEYTEGNLVPQVRTGSTLKVFLNTLIATDEIALAQSVPDDVLEFTINNIQQGPQEIVPDTNWTRFIGDCTIKATALSSVNVYFDNYVPNMRQLNYVINDSGKNLFIRGGQRTVYLNGAPTEAAQVTNAQDFTYLCTQNALFVQTYAKS